MLKTTKWAKNLLLSIAEGTEIGSIGDVGDCEDKTVKGSPLTSKNLNGAIGYLTPGAKQAFTQSTQAFTKTPILRHFDSKCHIQIQTDASG